TVSRRSSIRRSQWQGLATGAAGEGSRQRDRELSSDRGDRIFDVPFGSDWRSLGVWDAGIGEAFRATRGLRGDRRSFADEKTVGGDAEGGVMMESAPASPLEVGEAELAFEFLVVALDAPPQFGRVDELIEGRVLGQGRKPIFRRLFFALGPFDQKPFQRVGHRSLLVPRSRPDAHGSEARRQDFVRTLPPWNDAPSLVGKSLRQSLGGNGTCSSSRRMREDGRPRPLQGLGGSCSVPG